jgi:PAS domain S-box-containing protein
MGENRTSETQAAGLDQKIAELERSVMSLERKSKFFEMLIRSLPGVFYVIEDTLKFQSWNRNLEEVTGYSSEEVRTKTVMDMFVGEDAQRILEAIQKALATGAATVEADVATKDGARIPHLFSGTSARMQDASYVLGIGTDLSALKHATDALRESEAFYRMLAERMTVGVLLAHRSKIVFVNDALASMLGYDDSEELLGQDALSLAASGPDTHSLGVFEALERGVSGEKPFETRWRTKSGGEIWIEGRASLIQWKSLPTVFMTLRDITEAKLREITMQQDAEHLRRENISLRSSIKDRFRLGNIIGKSRAMQEVYERILNAAATKANVIIYGESGTGKELVARAIHDGSPRSQKPFVPVNCAAIPENLLESEFFGHKKGAFTGAHADKRGYLDVAHGGTLFLDEVGELSLSLQAKLLRAIEDGGYTPVGSSVNKEADFRVIAATNRDLLEELRQGGMREDFFYRIHVIPINVPPLRDRREDIPLLLEHFLKRYSEEGTMKPIPGHVIGELINYEWPGNVRELQNAIQRYLAVERLEFIPPQGSHREEAGEAQKQTEKEEEEEDFLLEGSLMEAETVAVRRALDRCLGNRTRAAKMLGISRKTLLRKLKRLELS